MPLQNISPKSAFFAAREQIEPSKAESLPEFYRLIKDRLGTPYSNEMGRVDRYRTMGWLFRELELRFPDGPRIVETGCIRSPEDWSAGYATWLFGTFLELTGTGQLISVDNDAEHLAIARTLCADLTRIFFINADSAIYLGGGDGAGYMKPFDLIYLDSLDTWAPGHAEHGLAEAKAASRIVAPNGLIVFDDSPKTADGLGWQGKGAAGIPWLLANGWKVLPVSSYQCVLERCSHVRMVPEEKS